jgi:hypothetical protein
MVDSDRDEAADVDAKPSLWRQAIGLQQRIRNAQARITGDRFARFDRLNARAMPVSGPLWKIFFAQGKSDTGWAFAAFLTSWRAHANCDAAQSKSRTCRPRECRWHLDLQRTANHARVIDAMRARSICV